MVVVLLKAENGKPCWMLRSLEGIALGEHLVSGRTFGMSLWRNLAQNSFNHARQTLQGRRSSHKFFLMSLSVSSLEFAQGILFLKKNTLRERGQGGKVIAAGGRGAEQRRRGLALPCSGVSVVLLWCMLPALLALPYWCFYTFGKI